MINDLPVLFSKWKERAIIFSISISHFYSLFLCSKVAKLSGGLIPGLHLKGSTKRLVYLIQSKLIISQTKAESGKSFEFGKKSILEQKKKMLSPIVNIYVCFAFFKTVI